MLPISPAGRWMACVLYDAEEGLMGRRAPPVMVVQQRAVNPGRPIRQYPILEVTAA